MKLTNRVIAATAFTVALAFTYTVAEAQIGPNPKNGPRQGRIAGLWDVEVTVTHCESGVPLATFQALHKFERGGTGQIVPATNPAALSAHMMIWSHVDESDYLQSAKFYRFDGAGTAVGWVVLTNEITLNPDADEYEGSGVAEIFDADGNLLATSCPILAATRFTGGE